MEGKEGKINYLNLTEQEFLDLHLFKYLPLSRAIESISSDSLWFSNPEEWNDPYESYYMNNAYDKQQIPFEFPLKDNLFATCFSSVSRGEAQWRSYSENGMAVMLDISPSELQKSLAQLLAEYHVYVGKVVYLPQCILNKDDVSDIIAAMGVSCPGNDLEKALHLMLCKRKAFLYEAEIRVFLIPNTRLLKYKKGVEVNVNLKAMTKRYTISPLRKKLQDAIKTLLLAINGVKNVSCSTLYYPAVNKVLKW